MRIFLFSFVRSKQERSSPFGSLRWTVGQRRPVTVSRRIDIGRSENALKSSATYYSKSTTHELQGDLLQRPQYNVFLPIASLLRTKKGARFRPISCEWCRWWPHTRHDMMPTPARPLRFWPRTIVTMFDQGLVDISQQPEMVPKPSFPRLSTYRPVSSSSDQQYSG
jgi:hypothetical protein